MIGPPSQKIHLRPSDHSHSCDKSAQLRSLGCPFSLLFSLHTFSTPCRRQDPKRTKRHATLHTQSMTSHSTTTLTVPSISSTPFAKTRHGTVQYRELNMSSDHPQGTSQEYRPQDPRSVVSQDFPFFRCLPVELQMMIWERVPFKPRWVTIHSDGLRAQPGDCKSPAVLHACRLSRKSALKDLVIVARIIPRKRNGYGNSWWDCQEFPQIDRTVPFYVHPDYDIFWTLSKPRFWRHIVILPQLSEWERNEYFSLETISAMVKQELPRDLDVSLLKNVAIGPLIRACHLHGIKSKEDLSNCVTAVFPSAKKAIFAWQEPECSTSSPWGPTDNKSELEWFDVVEPTSELAQSGPTADTRFRPERLYLYQLTLNPPVRKVTKSSL